MSEIEIVSSKLFFPSCLCISNTLGMSALYPEMKFSWEIKSVDELFYNNLNRFNAIYRVAYKSCPISCYRLFLIIGLGI